MIFFHLNDRFAASVSFWEPRFFHVRCAARRICIGMTFLESSFSSNSLIRSFKLAMMRMSCPTCSSMRMSCCSIFFIVMPPFSMVECGGSGPRRMLSASIIGLSRQLLTPLDMRESPPCHTLFSPTFIRSLFFHSYSVVVHRTFCGPPFLLLCLSYVSSFTVNR